MTGDSGRPSIEELQRRVELAPEDETAATALVGAYDRIGDRTLARRVAQQCLERISREGAAAPARLLARLLSTEPPSDEPLRCIYRVNAGWQGGALCGVSTPQRYPLGGSKSESRSSCELVVATTVGHLFHLDLVSRKWTKLGAWRGEEAIEDPTRAPRRVELWPVPQHDGGDATQPSRSFASALRLGLGESAIVSPRGEVVRFFEELSALCCASGGWLVGTSDGEVCDIALDGSLRGRWRPSGPGPIWGVARSGRAITLLHDRQGLLQFDAFGARTSRLRHRDGMLLSPATRLAEDGGRAIRLVPGSETPKMELFEVATAQVTKLEVAQPVSVWSVDSAVQTAAFWGKGELQLRRLEDEAGRSAAVSGEGVFDLIVGLHAVLVAATDRIEIWG